MKAQVFLPVLIASVVLSGFLGATNDSANAENVQVQMRRKVAYIKITGELMEGLPVGSEGSGVIISSDGYILTSYHLFHPVEKAKPGSIVISVSVGEKKSPPDRRAYLVDAKENNDLALLKLTTTLEHLPFSPLGTTGGLSDGDELFTSGFPKTLDGGIRSNRTSIEGMEGPVGTWVLKGTVDEGESGSPVYRQDGSLVGIVKGTMGASTAFVPVDLAEPLLLPQRLQNLRDQVSGLTEILSKPEDLLKKIDAEVTAFLSQDKGRELLASWLKRHMETADIADLDKFFERNRTQIEFEIDRYMKRVVAYSYSNEFFLGTEVGSRKIHSMPFYKSDGDMGELRCVASYSEKSKAKIKYSFNDQDNDEHKIREFGLSPITDDQKARTKFELPPQNKDLYDVSDSEFDARQVVNFAVEDKDPILTPIAVQCTIIITGSAKLVSTSRH